MKYFTFQNFTAFLAVIALTVGTISLVTCLSTEQLQAGEDPYYIAQIYRGAITKAINAIERENYEEAQQHLQDALRITNQECRWVGEEGYRWFTCDGAAKR
jgi:Flp pilus assembly protein TadD